ncbi:MAG: alpha/beta hydrolase [Reyranellaceae bacterium]
MPKIKLNDIELYYEETGSGFPVIFCHEFAGDRRSWEPQVRHFARRYRVITYNYRGYSPSDVPVDPAAYSQDILIADMHALMKALAIEQAHVIGIATGGNVALNFAIAHPEVTKSAIVAGAGAGTADRERWLTAGRAMADAIAREGTEAIVKSVERAPQRQSLRTKDPRAWAEFIDIIRDLSPKGAELSMRGVLLLRKPVSALVERIKDLPMPVLVMVGDQDTPAWEASLLVHRHAPHCGLAVLPFTGHTLPVEEPELFNSLVDPFLAAVDSGRWGSWRAEA